MECVRRKSESRFFTAMLLLTQIVGLYKISTTIFTLGDLAVFLAILFALTRSIFEKKIVICMELLPYYLYIVLHLLLSFLLRQIDDPIDFMGSTMRYLMILTAVIFFAKQYFDVEYGIKLYRALCILSTVLVIVQTVGTLVFGVYVKGTIDISFLPLNRSELYTYGDSIPLGSIMLRPRSFFGEPAHVATFSMGYLAIALFKEKNMWMSVFVSLGILLTMSSAGILMCICAWVLYFYKESKGGISRKKLIVFTAIAGAAMLAVNTPFFQYFLFRLLNTRSTYNRFESYGDLSYYFQNRPFFFLFGYGIGGVEQRTYAAAFFELIISLGICGLCIFAGGAIKLLRRRTGWQRYLLIIFLGFQLGTEFLFGGFLLCYLPFVVCAVENSDTPCCIERPGAFPIKKSGKRCFL